MHELNERRYGIALVALMVVFGAAVGLVSRLLQLPGSSCSGLMGGFVGAAAVGGRAFARWQVQRGRFQWLRRQ